MSKGLKDTRVLVTGATGYVGGELVPPLLDAGADVRVLARDARGLDDRPWRAEVDVVEGDATQPADLDRALDGIDTAYYLLHSMDGGGHLGDRDRDMAQTFTAAAERAGVRRIVYLGGMHPGGALSEHLASRAEVGQVFLDGKVPAVVLQAAVILGAGSASFQMLRYLTGRLPVMIAPKWLRNRLQPIAIEDVLHYLIDAATLDGDVNRAFDIGGPEILTYQELIQRYAKVTGRRKRAIALLPVLTPELASVWVGAVTPVESTVARPLVGSLVHEVVARESDIRGLLSRPGGLVGIDDALRSAERASPTDTGPRNLLITTVATTAAAALGSWATDTGSRWYKSIDKPAWQPPALTFPVVWTALYGTIAGTSASTLTTHDRNDERTEAGRYRAALLTNLALNAGWSLTFFRGKNPAAATVVSAALAASSADLARRAGNTKPSRGATLAPYAAWCAFATALSASIARRNR